MDALIDSLTVVFVDWGYAGLFVSALVAGSILPFSSELVMIMLLRLGLDPLLCVLFATAGNTLGGMTCYWIGRMGKTGWIEKYLKIGRDKLDRASSFLSGRGAVMGFFAFLPYIGEAVAIVLGLMRANVWIAAVSMIVGKALRYVAVLLAYEGVLAIF